jgi:hypothetical protein
VAVQVVVELCFLRSVTVLQQQIVVVAIGSPVAASKSQIEQLVELLNKAAAAKVGATTVVAAVIRVVGKKAGSPVINFAPDPY